MQTNLKRKNYYLDENRFGQVRAILARRPAGRSSLSRGQRHLVNDSLLVLSADHSVRPASLVAATLSVERLLVPSPLAWVTISSTLLSRSRGRLMRASSRSATRA
jgi:hypothetical protein